MAVVGVGVDVCSEARIVAALAEHGERFASRVLTPRERAEREVDARLLARRWAMKEAVAKALGTGIGAVYGFHDIEIAHTPAGAPFVTVSGLPDGCRICISVSDDAGIAIAYAIMERDDGNA